MPRTLAQNAEYIANTIKPAIKSAIEAQGVTVPSTDSFLDYADRIGEIEGGGSGYQLKDLPTGSISTVNDAAELPLNALKVSVEAWQEGSGDPSPSNIRPIHGWDSGTIVDLSDTTNKEYFDGLLQGKYGFIDLGSLTWTYNSAYSIFYSNAVSTMLNVDVNTIYSMVVNGYAVHSNEEVFDGHGSPQIDKAIWSVAQTIRISDSRYNKGTDLKASLDGVYLVYELATAVTPSITEADFSTVLNSFDINGWFKQADFPQTIYGAEWDVINGELGLKITDGFEVFDGSDDEGWRLSSSAGLRVDTLMLSGTIKKVQSSAVANIKCNSFATKSSISTYAGNIGISVDGAGYLAIADGSGSMTVEGWKSWLSEHPLQVKYELATPTTIDLSPLSIRMLEGTNNVYADCGKVIEGEYFVDEGAIDVRKVDYQIGASGSIKTIDGRVLSGFASMSGYHARPLDASGNWLDVDWSKSFEIGIAFKYTVADTNQTLFGSGIGNANYYKCPMIMLHPASQQFEIDISTTGNSWDMTMSQTVTYASLTINKWYFLKMIFNQSDMSLVIQISDDFSTWDTLLSITMSAAYYHDAASLCFGGFVQNSSFSSNNLLIDTFNTYIKGDGVNWGASTGAFPS